MVFYVIIVCGLGIYLYICEVLREVFNLLCFCVIDQILFVCYKFTHVGYGGSC